MKGSDPYLTVLSRRLPLGPEETHEDKLLLSHIHLIIWFFLNHKYKLSRHVMVAIKRSLLS